MTREQDIARHDARDRQKVANLLKALSDGRLTPGMIVARKR